MPDKNIQISTSLSRKGKKPIKPLEENLSQNTKESEMVNKLTIPELKLGSLNFKRVTDEQYTYRPTKQEILKLKSRVTPETLQKEGLGSMSEKINLAILSGQNDPITFPIHILVDNQNLIEITRTLSSKGGSGRIFEGTYKGNPVAIKTIPFDIDGGTQDSPGKDRMLNEVRSLNLLNKLEEKNESKRFVTLEGCFVDLNKQYAIIVTKKEGVDLADALERKLIPPSELKNIQKYIEESLDILDQHHITHNKLNPKNIVFEPTDTQFEKPKIIDFSNASLGSDQKNELSVKIIDENWLQSIYNKNHYQ